ncbi:DNA-binding CsgD family transcriptional regulator [Bradyrhizobium sp. USDA 377]
MTDTHQVALTSRTVILSPREKRLLRRFARGKTDKMIAQEIGGTAKQVAAARAMLTKKLGIHSQEQFAVAASELAPWPGYPTRVRPYTD